MVLADSRVGSLASVPFCDQDKRAAAEVKRLVTNDYNVFGNRLLTQVSFLAILKPEVEISQDDQQTTTNQLKNRSNAGNDITNGNSSWDAPLLTAKENALAPDDYNEYENGRISRHSDLILFTFFPEPEEEDALELARRLEQELAGSIVALWQQRLTQSSSFEGDIDIEYASESEPPTPVPDDPSVIVPPPKHFTDAQERLSGEDLNGNSRPTNPLAPVRLAMPAPSASGSTNANTALEEIRSRLRKTKFDYTSDSRQRISDATPSLPGAGDFRNVLKKNKA
ncbi:hypothetical protein PoB_001614000 [Plakobranchus ocellatus]|uniref:Uncharacterized protein n=1 Tax=Plakobranchus ocellatus TaxID=259542 RepID=A0AAV3Z4V4_9GAST|nr:hypothetical protein PoB_001614000 [Plakobranchus ocellatus]